MDKIINAMLEQGVHISTHLNGHEGWCGYYYLTPNDHDYSKTSSFQVPLWKVFKAGEEHVQALKEELGLTDAPTT